MIFKWGLVLFLHARNYGRELMKIIGGIQGDDGTGHIVPVDYGTSEYADTP